MATLVLTAAATAFTASVGTNAVVTALITTAATVAGKLIDNAVFGGGRDTTQEGPRLDDLRVLSSSQGKGIPRMYGRVRLGGEVIWATNLEEVKSTTSQGGKGGGPKVTTTEYTYYANFAVGLGEGPIGYVNRIWADGKEIETGDLDYRVYTGTETQSPDPLIESVEGTDNAPAYRGLAYVVFERLDLTNFGNRIPQLTFEIMRPAPGASVEAAIRGVNLIPGSTEFGYEPDIIEQEVKSSSGKVTGKRIENAHSLSGKSDWEMSIDQMEKALPDLETVCLVVSWFFDDLRCGEAKIRPHVENSTKSTTPRQWRAAGLSRSQAVVMSTVGSGDDERPAFGGAPDDESVIHAIRDLKARGFRVMLYPFMMGDIPPGNGLADPYGGGEQAVYPWRGRITCHPAPGQAGSPDKSTAAATQVAAFVGSAQAAHFSHTGDQINYSGPANDWGYRRFALHMASLAKAAGGVNSICIGSEMRSMTQVRSGVTSYPFVDALKALAGDVRTIVGASTKIGYAADWSEYHSHRPDDGSGDVIFNLDPLWSDDDIDFIGIDNYFPISDWRDGSDHLDFDPERGHVTPYEIDYLQSNIEGGEYFDWYYASDADRSNQVRTPISDGAHQEHWIFRQKDLRGWWTTAHHNRPGGVRASSSTDWTPGSKPIWFTEIGCPAVDKAANQPNVFYDLKSSEGFLPYFSSGARDDVMQRRYIEATLDYWALENETHSSTNVTMITVDEINVWSWDARPFPSWPLDSASWGDHGNWQFGHWLSARMGTVYVPDLMNHIAADYGFSGGDFERAFGACDGYVIDRTMSLRDAFSPLSSAFFFDLVETGSSIKAVSRLGAPVTVTLDPAHLALADDSEGADVVTVTRKQETELPRAMRITFVDAERAYRSTTVEATRDGVTSTAVSEISMAIVLDEPRAQSVADRWLADTWAGRETAGFMAAPSLLRVEAGDIAKVTFGDFDVDMRVIEIGDGATRSITASAFADTQLSPRAIATPERPLPKPPSIVYPLIEFMDLPLLQDGDDAAAGYIAVTADPWPGSVAIYRSASTSGWTAEGAVSQPAVMGQLVTGLASGPVGVWDYANTFEIEVFSGQLESLNRLATLDGGNAFAIKKPSGVWEIIQARDIELTGTNRYRLSVLLRGQVGTDHAVSDAAIAGASIVLLSDVIIQSTTGIDDLDQSYNYRFGPAGIAIGSDSYTTETHAFTCEALRPLSPVHIRQTQGGSGDHAFTWVRRTRTGGDSWVIATTPLGEDVESYEVDIIAGGEVKRTLTSSTATITYTAGDRVADLGSATAAYSIRVYQMSAMIGRGHSAAFAATA